MDIRVLEIEKRYKKGKEEHWILYAPAHNIQNCQTWEKAERLMPPVADSEQEEEIKQRDPVGTKLFHMRAVWSQISPVYEAWLKGETVQEKGTPLGAWAGANPGQVKELKRHGVNTVEALAKANEGQMRKINLPDLRALKRSAETYLDSASASELSDKVAAGEEQLAASMEIIADLQKKVADMEKKKGKAA